METTHQSDDDSPYDIRVLNEHPKASVDHSQITRAIELALKEHDCSGCSLSVALVPDETISGIHEQFMGVAGTTDVISFDLGDEDAERLDGELVICLDTAAREAESRKHDLVAEVQLYAIHGTLHLLGYDDNTEENALKMHAREDELLTLLGTGPVYGAKPE